MKSFNYNPIHSLFVLLALCMGASCHTGNSSHSNQNLQEDSLSTVKLEPAWTTDTALLTPESVLWIPEGAFFYVSEVEGKTNGKDEQGGIAKVGPKGQILDLQWAAGLNAPKGLGIYKDTLFVADLSELVLIDTASGKIIQKTKAPGATFLNDVAVDKDGSVYVSDTRQGKVYRYAKGQITVFLETPEVEGANGLLIKQNTLWILTAKGIYTCDMDGKNLKLFSDAVKGGDGITPVNDSDLIASRWAGEVYYVHANGQADLLLDTKEEGRNTADLDYIPELKLLIIPTFNGNTLAAYEIKR